MQPSALQQLKPHLQQLQQTLSPYCKRAADLYHQGGIALTNRTRPYLNEKVQSVFEELYRTAPTWIPLVCMPKIFSQALVPIAACAIDKQEVAKIISDETATTIYDGIFNTMLLHAINDGVSLRGYRLAFDVAITGILWLKTTKPQHNP